MYSCGQTSSKCTFQVFSYLTSNVFSLANVNTNLPMRLNFMNQNEKNKFFFFFRTLAQLVFSMNQQPESLSS